MNNFYTFNYVNSTSPVKEFWMLRRLPKPIMDQSASVQLKRKPAAFEQKAFQVLHLIQDLSAIGMKIKIVLYSNW